MKLIRFLIDKIHLNFLRKELVRLNDQIKREKDRNKKFKKFKNTSNSEQLEKLLLQKKEVKWEIEKIKLDN